MSIKMTGMDFVEVVAICFFLIKTNRFTIKLSNINNLHKSITIPLSVVIAIKTS